MDCNSLSLFLILYAYMITVNNLSVHFPGGYLFKDISFVIGDNEKIGLVGKNGVGKSTLLKILSSKQDYESGSIVQSKDETTGYLPQEMYPDSKSSVLEEALKAFDGLHSMERELEQINSKMHEVQDYSSNEYKKMLTRYSELNEHLNLLKENDILGKTEKVLLGLGFVREDFNRKMTEFSSGWQMRVELAKILLQKPDVILLDEPTNHLDIESIQWLENFLKVYNGAVILVSHDKTFLDNICSRTIEINAGKIYDYKVPYSEYVVLLNQRRMQQAAQLNNQQKQIADIEKFIERFRYKATKSKQVQSRIKMLEKMDKIEVDEIDTSSIHFKFPPAPHSGKTVVEIKNLSKSYDDNKVLNDVSISIQRGEKVAFVGKNGEGKSTLSKIIVGQIDDYQGTFNLGYQVSIGYFAQNQAALLDGEKTVYETIDEIAQGEVRTRIRNILGSFLFDENDIEKKVKVLSGGEKTRLALAKLLLAPVNLLVLDEPTNHLDMVSKDILKIALMAYDGTLIVVSHDRDFLHMLTDTLYEFKHHQVSLFNGDIFEFMQNKQLKDLDELNRTETKDNTGNKTDKHVTQNKLNYQKNKEKESLLRKIRNQIKATENQIEQLEKQIHSMDSELSDMDNAKNIYENNDFFVRYEQRKQELSDCMQKWEELQNELEEKQNEC